MNLIGSRQESMLKFAFTISDVCVDECLYVNKSLNYNQVKSRSFIYRF